MLESIHFTLCLCQHPDIYYSTHLLASLFSEEHLTLYLEVVCASRFLVVRT